MKKRDKILLIIFLLLIVLLLGLLIFKDALINYANNKAEAPKEIVEKVEVEVEKPAIDIEEPMVEVEGPILNIKKPEVEVEVETDIEEELVVETEIETPIEVFPKIKYYTLGSGFFTDDLDGDGIEETWNLFGDYYAEDDMYELSLIVNEQNVTEPEWGFYSNQVAVVQFPGDSKKYILVSDYGPSNDYVTTVYSYDKNKGAHVDMIEGIIVNGSLKVYGDKTIVSEHRANILQTWWYYITYDVTDDGLVKREQDFYDVVEIPGLNWGSETLMDFDFYTKPNLDSEKVTLPCGAYVFFNRLDDEHWVEINYDKYDEKQTAYLYVEDFYIVDREKGIDATMLFNNLLMAD